MSNAETCSAIIRALATPCGLVELARRAGANPRAVNEALAVLVPEGTVHAAGKPGTYERRYALTADEAEASSAAAREAFCSARQRIARGRRPDLRPAFVAALNEGPQSRAELADRLGVSAETVARLIAEHHVPGFGGKARRARVFAWKLEDARAAYETRPASPDHRTCRAQAEPAPESGVRRAAAPAVAAAPAEVEARPSSAEPFRLRVVRADEVSAPTDMFVCTPFGGARISAASCVKRQTMGRKVYAELAAIERVTGARASAVACRSCEVGVVVAARLDAARGAVRRAS